MANITGADIVYGPNADPEYDAVIAEDNQVFTFGSASLTTIHTPGHTLESTSFLLKDEQGNEHSIFTGDTLFLGDVGIPDVAQRYKGVSKEELAGTLYDSVNNKIKNLPEDEVAKDLGYTTNEKNRKAGYKQIKNLKKMFKEKAILIIKEKDIIITNE